MTAQAAAQMEGRSGVLVVSGYGIRVAVERAHLAVNDGFGRERRTRRFPKVGHGLRRLIVIGHTGTISLEALRWLDRTGIHFAHIDDNGRAVTGSAREPTRNARLRRAQALAYDTHTGCQIARVLLDAKVAGQARILRDDLADPRAAAKLDVHHERLGRCLTVAEMQEVEARAAIGYFAAWRNHVAIRWAARDLDCVPDHWRSFGGRRSLLLRTTNARATDPVNATLNYLYALGEIECRRACLVLGLDPGLGFLHNDTDTRDSLALDLIEAIRPEIDRCALRLAGTQTFAARDFIETDDGHCRISEPIARQLAHTLPQWEQAIAPIAETVAHLIADSSPYKLQKPKPLTGATRRATALATSAARRKSTEPSSGQQRPRRTTPPVEPRCRHCATPLPTSATNYCPECWPVYREAGRRKAVAASAAALAQAGERTRRGTATSMGKANSMQRYMAEHGLQITDWDRIALKVSMLSLREIMDATGLAISHASRIRSGSFRPHPRHWHTLAGRVAATSQ